LKVSINLTSNDKKLKGKLDNLLQRQIPFAMSKSLNKLTEDIRDKDLARVYGRAFEKRNESFFRLTHDIRRSTKSQWKRLGAVISAIQPGEDATRLGMSGRPKRVDTSFMNLHVKGGLRKPKKAKLAVPVTIGSPNAIYPITRNKRSGKVTKSRKASTLYPQQRTFMAKNVLMVRTGKRTKKAAYHFQPSVRITRKYSPVQAVQSGLRTRATQAIRIGFTQALRSAKIRL
jgi:hypothetical protein